MTFSSSPTNGRGDCKIKCASCFLLTHFILQSHLLKRDFHADKPFEKLTTDITEFKIGNEKGYLSPVLDMFNREIVSYSISTSPNLQQIRDMLSGLFEKLPVAARPLFHSDQGW